MCARHVLGLPASRKLDKVPMQIEVVVKLLKILDL